MAWFQLLRDLQLTYYFVDHLVSYIYEHLREYECFQKSEILSQKRLTRGNTVTGKPVVFIVAQWVKKPNCPEANLGIY